MTDHDALTFALDRLPPPPKVPDMPIPRRLPKPRRLHTPPAWAPPPASDATIAPKAK